EEVIAVEPWSEAEVLSLAAGLERSSEHPLAKAIVEGTAARNITPREIGAFQSLTGLGVMGKDGARIVALGNRELMGQVGADLRSVENDVNSLLGTGRTVMLLAVDRTLAGAIAVGDPIKESTPEALRALKAERLRIVMLTGDAH